MAALVVALLYASVIDFSTDTPRLGPYLRLSPPTQLAAALCAGGLCLLAALLLPPRLPVPRAGRILKRLVRLAPIAAAVASFLWTRELVPRTAGGPWNAFVVGAPVVMGLIALSPLGNVWLAAAAAVTGVVLRVIHFGAFGPSVGNDMLPLTTSALTSLFAGQPPYATYALPAPLPLTYYPLTFLAYAPAHLAGIDVRWTNVVAQVVVAGAAVFVAVRTRRSGRWRDRIDTPALILWSFVFLLPSSVYFDRITNAPVAWASLAVMLALVATGNRFASVAVGLAAATTPLTMVLAPFVGLCWWRSRGLRRALLDSAVAALLAAALLLPWILWSPRAFLDGAVLWFNDLDRFPRDKWVRFKTWQRYVGFSGFYWRTGLEAWLKPTQALGVAIVAALFAWAGARPARLGRFCAAGFTAFMVFNPVLWPYFYQPALVAMLIVLAAPTDWQPVGRFRRSFSAPVSGEPPQL